MGVLQARATVPVEAAGDSHDGWDFDCEWDPSLISPDGAGPAADGAAADATPTAPSTGDQCWVGLGPSSDQSTASHAPPHCRASADGAKAGPRESPQLVAYPQLFTGRRDSAGSGGALVTPSSKRSEQQMPEPQAGASRGPTITADSTWDEVQQVLGDGGRATIHSRGFASNPFGPTLVYGYRGVAFEALKNGHLAGLTLFQA